MEKVIDFKKTYIQLRVNKSFGLGFDISSSGLVLIIFCFYAGVHSKNDLW